MGKSMNIDEGVKLFRETKDAILIDVRYPFEYKQKHIPGSCNYTAQDIAKGNLENLGNLPKDTPIFVYCLSGSRSAKAMIVLEDLGYTNVTNIGGISAYSGPTE